MSKESYARGFCKAAEAAGVDPVALAKYAQVGINRYGPTVDNARLADFFRGAMKSNNSYSTISRPKVNKPLLPGGSRVGRVASNAGKGVLNSMFPGLGTGMNRLSSGIAGRIKSLLPR